MGDSIQPRVWRSGPYIPSVPRTGSEGDNIGWRKNNLITRGRDGRYYEESYRGESDLGEDSPMVALTGTLTINEGSDEIIGSGTLFNTECHLGQLISCIPIDNSANYPIAIKRIIDDEHMVVWSEQTSTVLGLIGWRMPRLYSINDMRGSSLTGNVLKLDRGSFLGVGSGIFRLNGQVLPGESMVLSRRPSIALYDPVLNTYSVFELGMDTPLPGSSAAVGGGTKGMQGGNYSTVITPARKETGGYNNPSDRSDVTISTGDMIARTFPAMDTANGQDAWILWGTTFADTLGADLNYLNGPWHRVRMIDDTEVSPAGGTVNFEWLDAEIENNILVSFNNDAPTDAEFVELLNAIPVWVSCQGQGFATNPEATSPGPFLSPAKPNNIEAAPLDLAFSSSPPETILGALMAEGRIYLLTPNKLQIAQSTPSDLVPILIRPFWHTGFANPDQIVFVDGNLYGMPVSGPTRSAGTGDETYVMHEWQAHVAEITNSWNPGQTKIAYDPQNDLVVVMHVFDHLNDAGFWTTRMLGFGVSQNFWTFDRLLTDDTKDRIVSGVATVADHLEMIISGRKT